MIPFFPEPYPDELLYSICARYSDRVQYPSAKHVLQELFGNRGLRASVDLPSYLNYFIAALPLGHNYTTEQLIDAHTLLPFYSPFSPPERVNLVRESMRGNSGQGIHARLGLTVRQSQDWLRFCPICAEEDKKHHGEFYWHRLHQVSGVEVCPIHAIFLENSNARLRIALQSSEFISAEQAIKPTSPRKLNLSDTCQKALLKIAMDAAWLVSQPNLVPGLESLCNRYLKLLAERGLASYKGTVDVLKLLHAFKNFYSPDLLKLLQCEIDAQSRNHWLSLLPRQKKRTYHPIRHLLLIQFLGYTAENFFRVSDEIKPFGDEPWPCLNPVCEHFRQPQIEECNINYTYQRRCRPLGTFQCTCGFVYSRIGPDLCAEDRFRLTRVESYGSKWEMALKNLWSNPEISVSEVARRLKVDHSTVKRHAARLGLLFPRVSARPIQMSAKLIARLNNSEATTPNKLETYRHEWLSVREANPKAGRDLLMTRFNRIYLWLLRHDSKWLEDHMPPKLHKNKVKISQPPRVDWESRDAKFATALKTSTLRFKNTPGRPVQITKTLICRDIGEIEKILHNLNRLPLTAKILAEFTETREEFAIRLIQWAADCFRQENVYPQRWKLVHRASIGWDTAELPQVKEVIDAALQSLASVSGVNGTETLAGN